MSRNAASCSSTVAESGLNRASKPLPSRRGRFSGGIFWLLRGGTLHQLLCQPHVSLCPDGTYVIQDDRLAKAWRLSKTNISGDDSREYLGSEILACVIGNLT